MLSPTAKRGCAQPPYSLKSGKGTSSLNEEGGRRADLLNLGASLITHDKVICDSSILEPRNFPLYLCDQFECCPHQPSLGTSVLRPVISLA